MIRWRFLLAHSALILLLATASQPASAAELFWDGFLIFDISADGVFNDAENWHDDLGMTPTNPPAVGDDAIFDLDDTYAVTFTQNEASDLLSVREGDVTFKSDSAAQRTYALATGQGSADINGGTLQVGISGNPVALDLGSFLDIGSAAADGTLVVEGTDSSVTTGSTTSIWGFAGNRADVTFRNNAIGSLGHISLALDTTSGTRGFFDVESGASVTTDNLAVAAAGGSSTTGRVTIDGSTSALTQNGASTLTVGHATSFSGAATIDVKNGGTFTTGTGTTTINASGRLNVGVIGGGTFNANANVTVDGGTLTRGITGSFNLATGLTLTAINDALVNFITTYDLDDGTTFDIQSGADLEVNGLNIGTNGHGTLIVDGLGSRLHVSVPDFYSWGSNGNTANVTIRNSATASVQANFLQVASGAGSTGILNVESGATAQMSNLGVAVAAGAGTSGTVNVDGAGTELTAGSLIAGNDVDSTATINVINGGTLTTVSTAINATGTLNVNTAGVFNNSGDITLAGTINLAGGTINLGGDLVFTGSTFNFDFGTLNFTTDQAVTAGGSIEQALGGERAITLGQHLSVEGIATIDAPLEIDGGTFSVGELVNGPLIDLRRGTLNINSQAVAIEPGGPFGNTLELAQHATINVALGITNHGLVTGNGSLGGSLANDTDGEILGLAGNNLVLTGSGNTNNGQITLTGGQVYFTQDLTNSATGLVIGNGTLRADGGVTNDGDMALSATANIIGNVTNNASGTIISAGGTTTFFDDVTNNGEIRTNENSFTVYFGSYSGNGDTGTGTVIMEGDLVPGSSPGIMAFGGSLSFGPAASLEVELGGLVAGSEFDLVTVASTASLNGNINVTLLDDFVPALGDTFEILTATDGVTGTFTGESLPDLGSLHALKTFYDANSVTLAVVPALSGDYNANGVVDAADYTVWRDLLGQTGAGLAADGTGPGGAPDGVVNQLDHQFWVDNFGNTAGSGSAISSAFPLPPSPLSAAVPEPASLALALLAALTWMAPCRAPCRGGGR